MRYKIIITCFLFISLISCEKLSENSEGNDIPKEIIGQWEWLFSFKPLPPGDTNPLTPENTGINEILEFKENEAWLLIHNNSHIDSGTFSAGHGVYTPYPNAYTYAYDSIAYYEYGSKNYISTDFYRTYNDTLIFCHCFAGMYGSGTKYFKKLKSPAFSFSWRRRLAQL